MPWLDVFGTDIDLANRELGQVCTELGWHSCQRTRQKNDAVAPPAISRHTDTRWGKFALKWQAKQKSWQAAKSSWLSGSEPTTSIVILTTCRAATRTARAVPLAPPLCDRAASQCLSTYSCPFWREFVFEYSLFCPAFIILFVVQPLCWPNGWLLSKSRPTGLFRWLAVGGRANRLGRLSPVYCGKFFIVKCTAWQS